MSPIRTFFDCAASGPSTLDTYWLLIFALMIAEDTERREKERRRKRKQAATPPQPRKPAGPGP